MLKLLIISILLFFLTWSLWMNFVANNILEIQSIQINQYQDDICKLYVVLNEVTGKEKGCVLPKTDFPDHITSP